MESLSPRRRTCSNGSPPPLPAHHDKHGTTAARPISHAPVQLNAADFGDAARPHLPTPTSLPNLLQMQDIRGSARPEPTIPLIDDNIKVTGGPGAQSFELDEELPQPDLEPRHDEQSEMGLPFEIDIDMDLEDSRDIDGMEIDRGDLSRPPSATTRTIAPFSSSHRPLRISRARYASSDSEGSPGPAHPLGLPSPPTACDPVAPSNKRTFSNVSASSGLSPSVLPTSSFSGGRVSALAPPTSPGLGSSTGSRARTPSLELPPATSSLASELAQYPLFRPPSPLDLDSRPNVVSARARTHSFESQRASTARVSGRRNLLEVARESAEGGESSRSSSLRRRSPVVADTADTLDIRCRSDGERGGSKRRRASTLLSGALDDEERSIPVTAHQGTHSFAPALGRYPSQAQPVEPVLSRGQSPATSEDNAESLQFRSRHRVAFGLARGGLGFGRSSALPSARQPSIDPDSSFETTEIRTPARHSFSRLPPWWRSTSSLQSTEIRSAPLHLSVSENPVAGTSRAFPSTVLLDAPRSRTSSTPLSNARSLASPADYHTAISQDERLHAEESRRLDREADSFLREAEETLHIRQAVLRDADETTRQALRLLHEDRQDRERERRISRLPNVGRLPEPAELSARPVIGLRIGEGWPATTSLANGVASPPAPVAQRRRSSLFSSLSPPPPPPPLSPGDSNPDTIAMGGTSSRTRQFLTSLRSRRPRFARNSTSASPPELASPPLAAEFDDEAERHAANDLNDRLLERRRISASLEPPTTGPGVGGDARARSPAVDSRRAGLWGESLVWTSRGRLRGPTEGQNERWRQGEPPALAGGSTTPALAVASTGTGANRFSLAFSPSTPLDSLGPHAPVGRLAEVANNATDSAAIAYFARRDDTPSPQRTPAARSSTRSFPTNLASDSPERGRTVLQPVATDGRDRTPPPTELGRLLSTDVTRRSIRLPLTAGSAAPVATSSRTRLELGDDDDDVDDEEDRRVREATRFSQAWNPPQLMLASGSEGRRMVFPHPARAFGMSDTLEDAEEGGVMQRGFGSGTAQSEPSSAGGSDRNPVRGEPSRSGGRGQPPRDDESYLASRFDLFDHVDLVTPGSWSADRFARTPPDSSANSRIVPPLASLSDSVPASSQLGLAEESGPNLALPSSSATATLRRRHFGSLSHAVLDGARPVAATREPTQEPADPVAERLAQHRTERLASLRRERTFMRGILGGTSIGAGPSSAGDGSGAPRSGSSARLSAAATEQSRERARDRLDLDLDRNRPAWTAGPSSASSPPRSPGFRRRGLGDFFRGFGTGGRLVSIFDEEFGAFFGRDAVALDSRNYLEDDEFDASYEGLLRLSAQIGDVKPKGVSQDALSKLRTFPYSKWPYVEHASASKDRDPVASTSSDKLEGEQDKPEFARVGVEKESRCAICLSDYEEDDDIALAHCSHGFHSECLKAWLKDHGSCPVCRRDHSSV